MSKPIKFKPLVSGIYTDIGGEYFSLTDVTVGKEYAGTWFDCGEIVPPKRIRALRAGIQFVDDVGARCFSNYSPERLEIIDAGD